LLGLFARRVPASRVLWYRSMSSDLSHGDRRHVERKSRETINRPHTEPWQTEDDEKKSER